MNLHISNISLEELMAEDFCLNIKKNSRHGYDLTIDSDEFIDIHVEDKAIHPCAMESFSNFCKEFLYQYENAKRCN